MRNEVNWFLSTSLFGNSIALGHFRSKFSFLVDITQRGRTSGRRGVPWLVRVRHREVSNLLDNPLTVPLYVCLCVQLKSFIIFSTLNIVFFRPVSSQQLVVSKWNNNFPSWWYVIQLDLSLEVTNFQVPGHKHITYIPSYFLTVLYNKINKRANSEINFWCEILHVSRNSSTHHQELSTEYSALPHVIKVWRQLACRIRAVLHTSCRQTCITCTNAECTVANSWWWVEELPKTCRVSHEKWISELARLLVLL